MGLFVRKKEEVTASWVLEKSFWEALVGSLEEGLIIYDKDFKIVVFNLAAEKIFGVAAKDVVDQVFSLNKARSFPSKTLAQAMFTSLAPTVVRRTEVGIYPQILDISLNDPIRELKIITNQILDDNGEVWGFVKLIKDRTRELELLRAKSDFVTIAAHKLRTPTTAVGWALDTMAKDKTLTKENKELLSIAQQTAHNLQKIVNDLINITQIEEGKFGYKFQKAKLVPFLEKILSEAEVVAREYKVKIYFERPQNLDLSAPIDATRLGMAISNLIDNAIKYNVENGEVVLSLNEMVGKPYIEVKIRDTGVGIPAADLDKIFTKFFRSENVKTKDVEGSGLGLYLTKNIINRHGGKMSVESKEDRGSTFTFTLPIDSKLIPLKQLED